LERPADRHRRPGRVLVNRGGRCCRRLPVPGLRQRGDDDGHRPDHRHPAPVRVRRRLVDDRELGGDGRAARDQRAQPPSPMIKPFAVMGLLKELRVAAEDTRPLAVGGALAAQLRKELTYALANRLGEGATPLAARLPVLRPAVCAWLIASFSRKNAIVGAAVWIPGVDLPVLTMNQMRLVLRIGSAYGEEISNERLPELLAVLGGGLGFRALARELLDAVPVGGWLIKGAVAYTGTRALGEAAVRLFEARARARV